MKIDEKILNRLNELIQKGQEVLKTRYSLQNVITSDKVNSEISNEWATNCLSLFSRVFGKDSDYYEKFNKLFPDFHDHWAVKKGFGILKAAKDDYENVYLFDTRVLIEAEVFDDFLEQAEHLLKQGYFAPAAVIAGCVLEDGLRKLCQRNSLALPAKATIEPMNVELAKAGIYNKLVQKKVTALADLRNKAAHGEWTEFSERDVEDMIRDMRRIMEDYLS